MADTLVKSHKIISNRYIQSVLCAALGDAIGFQWEFLYSTQKIRCILADMQHPYWLTVMKKYDTQKSAITTRRVSDDTIMHIATLNVITSFGVLQTIPDENGNKRLTFNATLFTHKLMDEYAACLDKHVMENRAPGTQSLNAVPTLTQRKFPAYSPKAGGNGAAMRTMGLVLKHLWQSPLLIQTAVIASAATHNHPTAILGGVMSAVFTSYAIKLGISSIREWPALFFGTRVMKMLKAKKDELNSQSMLDFISKCAVKTESTPKQVSPFEYTFYVCRRLGLDKQWPWQEQSGISKQNDIIFFLKKWLEYIKHGGAPSYQQVELWDLFWRQMAYPNGKKTWPGSSGHDAPMMAYDALLQIVSTMGSSSSSSNTTKSIVLKGAEWKRLMFPAAFHGGDSDTTATLAGAWIGALFDQVDDEMKDEFDLEFKWKLHGLAEVLYDTALLAEEE